MGDDWLFYVLLLLGLLWLSVILSGLWSRGRGATAQLTPTPAQPITKRCTEPKPFPGLTSKPLCDVCAHGAESCPPVSPAPPPLLVFTRGRRRALNTHPHFC